MHTDFDQYKEDNKVNIDNLAKATKTLQDQKLHKDELDDRRIQKHLTKAINQQEKETDDKIEKVMQHMHTLEEPLHAKFLVLSKEAECLARQNMRFVQLYRDCLQDLSKEIKEKKQVLDTSQLAFLTADPGLVSTKI